jgi:hypothetical protein
MLHLEKIICNFFRGNFQGKFMGLIFLNVSSFSLEISDIPLNFRVLARKKGPKKSAPRGSAKISMGCPWRSGHRICLRNKKTWVRIPQGIGFLRET